MSAYNSSLKIKCILQGYLGNMSPMCQISVRGLFWIASCILQIEDRHPWHRRYISIVWPFLVWIKLVWDIIYTLLSWDLFQCLILDELQCLYSSPTTAGSSVSSVEENEKNTAPSEFLLIFLTDRTIKKTLLLFYNGNKTVQPVFLQWHTDAPGVQQVAVSWQVEVGQRLLNWPERVLLSS